MHAELAAGKVAYSCQAFIPSSSRQIIILRVSLSCLCRVAVPKHGGNRLTEDTRRTSFL